jgi:predicted RNA-binding Zn-ribbon protein involved in translation (DUF1610 family)
MKIENPAVMVNEELVESKHVVEILCPNCNRDVDEDELSAQKCNDCGYELSTPKQGVSIFATSQPLGGKVWTQK